MSEKCSGGGAGSGAGDKRQVRLCSRDPSRE